MTEFLLTLALGMMIFSFIDSNRELTNNIIRLIVNCIIIVPILIFANSIHEKLSLGIFVLIIIINGMGLLDWECKVIDEDE